MSEEEATRRRFAATADRIAALSARRSGELSERVRRFVQPRGDERALDAGTGAGALAVALAPSVAEVVAVDLVPELLEHARRLAEPHPNVRLVEADITALPFDIASFDLAATARTLHHVARPELVVAELTRVTRFDGRLLVVDQIAPADPLRAIALDRFERSRDPSHARLLPDGDLRALFEANGLVLLRSEFVREERSVDDYLALAGCEGDEGKQARRLAPADPYTAEIGWYLLRHGGERL